VSDRLGAYRAKRDLEATPEPAPEAKRSRRSRAAKAGPRFTIQEHSARRLHWDLRLERDGVLVSFALPNGLPVEPGRNHLAVHTEDHPLEYLEFHGEIPKGNYGAGTMTVWDTGTYETLEWADDKIEIHLRGERVDAPYALFPLGRREGRDSDDWMIHLMGEALQAPMPDTIAPMLARPGSLPRDDAGWGYEFKWDGVRAVCHAEPGRMTLRSRNLNDITARYPELSGLTRALGHRRAILDGEVVAFEGGRPSFAALQGRMHLTDAAQVKRRAKASPVTYVLFDLLWLDGEPLTGLPYAERRARLDDLGLQDPRFTVSPMVEGRGADVLEAARSQGLEGVIAKRLDSVYESGRRSACWVKVKLVTRDDFLIAGWLPMKSHPPRRRERIGALLLGERDDDGALRAVGRVGTGFTEAELERLGERLAPLVRDDSPLAPGGPKVPRNAVYVDPVLSCEVEYLERSRDGILRAPSYKGLREDKGPAEARLVRRVKDAELLEVAGREVRLSNPDKVLWPATGFTKRDLLGYYLAVAPVLLPHLQDRRLTLKRYPDGAQGQHFFEKRAPSHRPEWVTTSGGHVVADGPATLAWLANLADLELHTPMARMDDPGRPTILAFDLDPGEGAGLAECCEVARWLKAMLDGLGLEAFPKTSGSKGLQVYVPLNHPDATQAQTKGFARMVAELLAREAPELVVATQVKTQRRGKVLVDWSQIDEH
jgi:bifunctional non-homologous end joining protein LigD